jgi:hypothetical protein
MLPRQNNGSKKTKFPASRRPTQLLLRFDDVANADVVQTVPIIATQAQQVKQKTSQKRSRKAINKYKK